MSQPLAKIGESKRYSLERGSIQEDLDVQLYNARKDLEYEYAQDPSSTNLFKIGNYVLALCGIYLLRAQAISGAGGTISPITHGGAPSVIEFIVSASSLIPTGGASIDLSAHGYIGYDVLIVRSHITQSKLNDGGVYYSWDSNTAVLTLLPNVGGEAQLGELIQIYPIQT